MRALRFLALLMLAWPAPGPAAAQSPPDWPKRAVHVIVPIAPGSAVDINARLMAGKLSAMWGQPVVVDNKPGADTLAAIGAFTRANDDHTLYFAPTGTFAMHPYILDKAPYDIDTDFLPIARVSKTVVGIFTPKSSGLDTLAKLVETARARPGKLNWTGSNNIADFVFDGFLTTSGLSMTHVPYRDLMLGIADLAEDRIQVGVVGYASARGVLDAGKLNIVSVVTHERAPAIPNVATAAELGFPGLTIDGLVGMFGPKGMPESLRAKIAADMKIVVADKEIADQLNGSAQIVEYGGPEAFAAAIAEQRRIAASIAALGVKALH